MKLTLIYEKEHHKLQDTSYSWVYKGQLDALIDRFEEVNFVHDSCSADDIDADVIIVYDIVSSHHITIENMAKHSAIKMSYLCDPHQKEMKGIYHQYKKPVHKLGKTKRIARAKERGIQYFIMPMRDAYFKDLGPIIGEDAEKMLLFFPPASKASLFTGREIPITERENKVALATGATWDGDLGSYEFRKWVYTQPYVHFVPHSLADKKTPSAQKWGAFIAKYSSGFALNDYHPIPKYFEMPLAGCLTFLQHFSELDELGFKDYENCVYVNNKYMAEPRVKDFLEYMGEYEKIAEAGRKLIEENYTAKHFADFIYNKCIEIQGN